MSDDDILDFNFAGVEPAIPGAWTTLPKGEYQLQCNGARRFFTGEGRGEPDSNKPNLEFSFIVINHPNTDYVGTEHKLFNSLSNNEWTRKFLLNTLMCLMPEIDWQKGGMQVPMSQLIQKVQGRMVNGLIEWEVSEKDGKKYVNNKLKALKKYDPTVAPPVATEGNPPSVVNTESSAVVKQANAGVSQDEVNSFLGEWPGGPAPAAVAANSTEDALDFSF